MLDPESETRAIPLASAVLRKTRPTIYASFSMKVSSTGASPAWPVSKSTGTPSKAAASTASDGVTGDFLKYANMSPMERMRANILKSLDLTEDKLSALPQEARQKIEGQIKDQIRKLMANSGGTGQLVSILA